MDPLSFVNSDMFTWVVLPLLIFLARIVDVTIGTLRIIFVSKGLKKTAPLLGFVETLIWLLAITHIIRNVGNPMGYLAFAGGFAAGNYVGIWLEEQLAVGYEVVQIITKREGSGIMAALKDSGYGVTSVAARGNEGRMRVIYTVVARSNVEEVVGLVKSVDPKAFYTIEQVREVAEATIPHREPRIKSVIKGPMRRLRKGA